jgi:hypothetical protein
MNVKFNQRTRMLLAVSCLLIARTPLVAQQSAGQDGSPAADNTTINQHDRNTDTPTADSGNARNCGDFTRFQE